MTQTTLSWGEQIGWADLELSWTEAIEAHRVKYQPARIDPTASRHRDTIRGRSNAAKNKGFSQFSLQVAAGNQASLEAFKRSKPTHRTDAETIYKMISLSGVLGVTSKDIAYLLGGRALHTFSGRITELLKAGRIRKAKERGLRDGCFVLVKL